MSNAADSMRLPAPTPSAALEFGRDLCGARMDPSDREACFNFLYVQHADRWREVMANLDDAIFEAGELYIAIQRQRA